MNPQEAEKIINAYGAALASSPQMVRRKFNLPCSVAKIKLAYYVYIDALVKNNALSQTIGDNLMFTYAELNTFVDDTYGSIVEDAISLFNEGIAMKEDEDTVTGFTHPIGKIRAMDELNDYIAECMRTKPTI